MDDSTGGSPGAAQRAQDDTPEDPAPEDRSRGLLGRFFGLGAPTENTEAAPHGTSAEVDSARPSTRQHGFRHLHELRVDDVAIPEADIVAVSETASLEEIVAVFRASTFTRLPVYRETLDEPVGLIHLKDLSLKYGFGTEEPFDIGPLIRPLIYAPPSMRLAVLLQRMQQERIHMALVIDEYGGVDGLITIEDLLEQIVGEIVDEFDEDEDVLWSEEAPGVYLVQARAPIDEFSRAVGASLGLDDLDEEIDTLGGVVFRLTGRVPVRGEVVRDEAGNEFEVVEADARRLKRLRVVLAGGQPQDRAAE